MKNKNQLEGPMFVLCLFYLFAVTLVSGYTKNRADKSDNWSILIMPGPSWPLASFF